MKILLLYIVTIFASSLLTVCEGQTKLPKEMPADARMSFASNGGMSPYFTSIEIEGEMLTFKERVPVNNASKISQVNWTAKITPEDKVSLYQTLVKNKFDQIENETNKSITYDAGSEGVSLSFAPNISYNVQSGANFPLSSANKTRYQTVAGEFVKLARKYESIGEDPVAASVADARKEAAAFFETINTDKSGKTMYQAKFTPFFPTEWTGSTFTKWISYVYAGGFEFSVVDGERTSKPFAKITFNPATQTAALEKLSGKLEDGDIQGIKPLPKESLEILKTAQEVEKILLQIKNRGALSDGDVKKVAAFYEFWKKYNGVIYQNIANNHSEFDTWIDDKIISNKVEK